MAEADRAAERLQDASRLIDEIAAAEDAGAASGACVAGAAAIDRRVDGARLAQALAELSESEPDERRKRIAVELARAFTAELEDEFPVWASIGLVVAALATVIALVRRGARMVGDGPGRGRRDRDGPDPLLASTLYERARAAVRARTRGDRPCRRRGRVDRRRT